MRKIIAVILVIAMLAICAGCTAATIKVEIPEEQAAAIAAILAGNAGNSNNNSSAQAPVAETPAAPQVETPVSQASETPTAATETPASPAAENSTAAPSTPAAPAASSGVPSTKDEIIAYYVTAYNKIGSDGGKITRTYDYTSNYNNILNINNNSTLESLANSLMNQFMVESKDPLETSFADLPPKGVSNLSISPSQISAATIKDNGTSYTVTLKSTGTDSNYEIDCQPGQGSAGVLGPLLRTEDVSSAAGSALSFDGLHAWYATASVTATIDKASGHITALDFQTPCILHFDQVKVVVLKVQNCDIGLLFQQKYTIAY